MRNEVAHFSVNADDVARARRFYTEVFGWAFESWGPPEFFLIKTQSKAGPAVQGALQKRREIVKGRPMVGFECTIAVDDIDRTLAAVTKNGGTVVMPKTTITGVGTLFFFQDTEGNIAGAMQYDEAAE
jgi:predicted enzyme related to lactoylglutathione lyase